MKIPLPFPIQAYLPCRFVQMLGDANIATIDVVPEIPERSIDVVVDNEHMFWQYGNERLRVSLCALELASFTVGSHGPNEYVFFTLHFGDRNGGGNRMLHAPIADAHKFDDVLKTLKLLLPCPFRDETAGALKL